MTVIRIVNPSGEVPRNNPQVLPDSCAQVAVDCDFTRNSVRGIQGNDPSGIIASNIKSLFVYDGGLSSGNPFYWTREVDALRSPVVNDAYGRFYWSDGSGFYVSDGRVGGNGEPSSTYRVGVPRPAAALGVSGRFQLPGAVGGTLSWVLADERDDGTLFNQTTVYPSETSNTMTGVTWSFQAREPQAATNAASTTTTTSGTSTTFTVSDVVSPVRGPVLVMTLTRADGVKLVVTLRKSPGETTWPTSLPGYTANFDVSGTSYSVKMGAASTSVEARAYTYTYVNQWGEEGSAADPVSIECAEGASVTLTYSAPPASAGYCPITKVRVYRTATGATTAFQYVGEVVVDSSRQFTDAVKTEALGEALSTSEFYPPAQDFAGIAQMSNGIMVGFKGNELWFSEPYLPYAYNPSNIKPLPNRIVGVCPFESGLYVTTTANPYFIMGVSPDAMTDSKLPALQAGVSKGSIVSLGTHVAYASNDGIVLARGLDASLDASFRFFTREVWRAKYGSKLGQMRFAVHDGMLVVWFSDGTPGFMLRLDESAMELTSLTAPIYGAFVHPTADALYVSTGSSIQVFRAGVGRKNFTWWSKDFSLPKPVNLSAAQVSGSGNVAVEVYADGVLQQTEALSLNNYDRVTFRMKGGFMARVWSFKFSGAGEMQEFHTATSMVELQNV